MSSDKKTKKVGTLHKKTRQKPLYPSIVDLAQAASKSEKTDFDEKDQNISPKRKAPGPGKRGRSHAAPAAGEAARMLPNQRPEADIKDDHNS